MRVIDRYRNPVADDWSPYVGEGGATAGAILPLEVFLERQPASAPLAVILAPGQPVELIAPHLASLALVCIDFPKFRDGRGFTMARKIRQGLGFPGEIRAVGHVLPDQFAALIACGFSTVLTPLAHPPEQWRPDAAAAREEKPVGGPLLLRMIDRGLAPSHAEKEGTNA